MKLTCRFFGHRLADGRWPWGVYGGASWAMKIGPCVRCGYVWYPGRPGGAA